MGAGGIGIRCLLIMAADLMNHGAVYLIKPVKGPRDGGRLLQAGAIGLDSRRFVTHVGAQIETGKDPFTDAAIPGGRQRPDTRRGWPVGFDPFHL